MGKQRKGKTPEKNLDVARKEIARAILALKELPYGVIGAVAKLKRRDVKYIQEAFNPTGDDIIHYRCTRDRCNASTAEGHRIVMAAFLRHIANILDGSPDPVDAEETDTAEELQGIIAQVEEAFPVSGPVEA